MIKDDTDDVNADADADTDDADADADADNVDYFQLIVIMKTDDDLN